MEYKDRIDKGLIKNILFQICYQSFVAIYPLLTTPIISKAFGTEGLGIYSYSYSIVSYISLFGSLGIHTYGGRNSSILRDDRKKLSENFCTLYCIQLCCSIGSILLYFVYSLCAKNICFDISILQGIFLCAAMFDITWFFSGLENYQVIVFRNCFIKVISLCLILLCVKSEKDLPIYILIINMSNLIGQLSIWPSVKQYVSFVKVSFSEAKKHVIPIIKLFFPVLAINANAMIDKLILGNAISMNAVGLYENSDKIIKIPISIANAACAVLVQRSAYNVAQGKKERNNQNVYFSLKYNFLFVIPTIVGLDIVISDVVPWFMGDEFKTCIFYVRYLSPVIILIIVNNILRLQYFMANKKDNIYIFSIILSVFVNTVINILTVNMLGINGIILGTILGEFSSVYYLVFKSYKDIPYILLLKDIAFFTLGAWIMGGILININLGNLSEMEKTFFQIVIGCSIYGLYLGLAYIISWIKRKI